MNMYLYTRVVKEIEMYFKSVKNLSLILLSKGFIHEAVKIPLCQVSISFKLIFAAY